MKKTRKVKAWAVLWKAPNAADYGMRHGTLINHVEENTPACAIFKKKEEAYKWYAGNEDWAVVPCTISFFIPKKSKRRTKKV